MVSYRYEQVVLVESSDPAPNLEPSEKWLTVRKNNRHTRKRFKQQCPISVDSIGVQRFLCDVSRRNSYGVTLGVAVPIMVARIEPQSVLGQHRMNVRHTEIAVSNGQVCDRTPKFAWICRDSQGDATDSQPSVIVLIETI